MAGQDKLKKITMEKLKTKVKTFKLVQLALCGAVLIFLIVVTYMRSRGDLFVNTIQNEYFLIAPVLVVLAIILGLSRHRQMLASVKEMVDAEKKLEKLQSDTIVRFTIMEAAAILNIVAFLKEGHALYFGAAVFMLIVMFVSRMSEKDVSTILFGDVHNI